MRRNLLLAGVAGALISFLSTAFATYSSCGGFVCLRSYFGFPFPIEEAMTADIVGTSRHLSAWGAAGDFFVWFLASFALLTGLGAGLAGRRVSVAPRGTAVKLLASLTAVLLVAAFFLLPVVVLHGYQCAGEVCTAEVSPSCVVLGVGGANDWFDGYAFPYHCQEGTVAAGASTAIAALSVTSSRTTR